MPRSTILTCVLLSMLDSFKRNTSLFDTLHGQFIASAIAAVTAFGVVWPLEVLKNLAQAET